MSHWRLIFPNKPILPIHRQYQILKILHEAFHQWYFPTKPFPLPPYAPTCPTQCPTSPMETSFCVEFRYKRGNHFAKHSSPTHTLCHMLTLLPPPTSHKRLLSNHELWLPQPSPSTSPQTLTKSLHHHESVFHTLFTIRNFFFHISVLAPYIPSNLDWNKFSTSIFPIRLY